MFATWTCNSTPDPVTEHIRRAIECRKVEFGKQTEAEKLQQYEACLQTIPRPIPPNQVKVSLGRPIGTSFGTIGIDFLKPADVSLQAYACCLVALGTAFIVPINNWKNLIINQILQDGKKLIEASATKDSSGKISEATINKRFVVYNNMIEVEIYDPEFTGKIQTVDVTVPRLLSAMKKFFKFSSYCLLWFASGIYYLIWRKHGMFFIWDAYGRDKETLEKKSGLNACLVTVRCPENLYHYIVHLGKISEDEMFSMRKIQISMIVPNCSNAKMNDITTKSAVSEFQVLGEKYALLRGHIHVGAICFKEFRYKQSLAVAIIALLYSKIAPPCSWDRLIIDEIVILGTIFYKVWNSCAHCFDLVIFDVPKRIRIGQFMIEISVDVKEETGEWKCVSNFRRSALTKAVKRCFAKSCNIVLQIEGKTYAIWRRNDVFYIFDPYEHQANRGEIERYKSSILHMCTTINQCCLILTQLILEIPAVRSYHIHSVRILNVSDCRILNKPAEGKSCCLTRSHGTADNAEVVSLNESVEDLACQKMFNCMGDIKDDDDVSFADLDSPGMSETQIPRDYFELRDQIEYEADLADAENRLRRELEAKLTAERGNHKSGREDRDFDGENGEEGEEEDWIKDSNAQDGMGDVGGAGDEKKITVESQDDKNKEGDGDQDDKNKEKKNEKDSNEANKDADAAYQQKIGDAEKVDKTEKEKADAQPKDSGQLGGDINGFKDAVTDTSNDAAKDIAKVVAKDEAKDVGKDGGTDASNDGKDIGVAGDKKQLGAGEQDGSRRISGSEETKSSETFLLNEMGDKSNDDERGKDSEKSKDNEKNKHSGQYDDTDGDHEKGQFGDNFGYIEKGENDGKKKECTELIEDEEEACKRKPGYKTLDDDDMNIICGSSDNEMDAEIVAKICKNSDPCTLNKKPRKKKKLDRGKEAYKEKCLELSTTNAVQEKLRKTRCPSINPFPKKLAIVGTENCTYNNLSKLFEAAFKCTDRLLAMTKFGNYIIFKCFHEYYLFDGCTCNLDRFRYLDLSTGTAGFIHLANLDDVIKIILSDSDKSKPSKNDIKTIVQDICDQYCP